MENSNRYCNQGFHLALLRGTHNSKTGGKSYEKTLHNGLLYVESEEGEQSMKKELIQVTEFNILEEVTVAKWTKLFGGLFKPMCFGYRQHL